MVFWPDITTLQAFYASPAGHVMCKQVHKHIACLWPHIQGETLMGIGFCHPYLKDFAEHNHSLLCMPEAQGSLHWPDPKHNRSCLVLENNLPVDDDSINRVIVAHTLEYTLNPHTFLRELWRVLAPGGKLLVIVPNRLGSWSYFGRTPFRSSNSFDLQGLTTSLKDSLFLPLQSTTLLFTPPVFPALLPKIMSWEHLCQCWLQPFGGVLVIEAEKQLYAIRGATNKVRRRRRILRAVG